jgi:hypothetical protein
MPLITDTQPGSDSSSESPRLLLEHHRQWLAVRAIADDIAAERGYASETSREALADLGFESYQRRVPCLVIPRFTTAGLNGDYQIHPDRPRQRRRDGKERLIKYETRSGSTARIDVHPRAVPILRDPGVMLLINEATTKGDAALGAGFHSLNVAGVFGWRGKNPYGGTCTIGDFDDVALNGRRLVPIVDSDGRDNPMVLSAASRLKKMLERRGAHVMVIVLPPGPEGCKQGLDDFRFAGGDLAALIAEAETTPSGIYVAASKRYAVNDIGNAQRFAAQHGHDVRFAWIEETGSWHAWTGTHWSRGAYETVQERAKRTMEALWGEAGAEPDPDHQAELKQHAHKSNHRYPITSMLTLARSDSRIATRLDRFDRDSDLLNVANGVLDLRTGELRPHHRNDLLTMIAPVSYDPNAPCPKFRAFLTRIFDGDSELIEYVKRALGYSLTGDTGARKLFIAEGGGANGKSTLFNLVADVLGDYGDRRGEAAG